MSARNWQVEWWQDVDNDDFLTFLQKQSQKWREHSFPPEHRTAELQTLGVCEEAGELAHAVLKRLQRIRGDDEEHSRKERDAVGDILVYLAGFCSSRGYSLLACGQSAWREVAQRDWSKYKETGKATAHARLYKEDSKGDKAPHTKTHATGGNL